MTRVLIALAAVSFCVMCPHPVSADDLVEQASSRSATDVQISKQLAAALKQRKDANQLGDATIDVAVDDGTVWIKGQTASAQQRALVLDVARRINGVRQIVNDIDVATPNTSHRRVESAPFDVQVKTRMLEHLLRQRDALEQRIKALETELGPRPPEPQMPNSQVPTLPLPWPQPMMPLYGTGSQRNLDWSDGWW